MKKMKLLVLALALVSINLNAQLNEIKCDRLDSKVFSFKVISAIGNEIKIEVKNDTGAAIGCSNLQVINGTCSGIPFYRNTKIWTINRTNINTPVKISFNSPNCGANNFVELPANFQTEIKCINEINGKINKGVLSLIKKVGKIITLKHYWNEYSTSDCSGLTIINGKCLTNARVNKNNAEVYHNIEQIDTTKEVYISWNSVYCGRAALKIK